MLFAVQFHARKRLKIQKKTLMKKFPNISSRFFSKRQMSVLLSERKKTGLLKGEDLITTIGLKKEKIEQILDVAHIMQEIVEKEGSTDILKGKILGNVFFEASTRTSSSYQSAMLRLGGTVLPCLFPNFFHVFKFFVQRHETKVSKMRKHFPLSNTKSNRLLQKKQKKNKKKQ